MIRKFKGILQSPGARITDQLCRSESRQAGFSCGFCYPLVSTVLNDAQITNRFAAHFKTEFFNRIGRKQTSLIHKNDGSHNHAIPVLDVQRHAGEEHVVLAQKPVNIEKLLVDWNVSGKEGLVYRSDPA